MLLAAGFGRRLLPITLTRAKPTLPFLHRPLLLRQLDYLQASSITDVVINTHHQPDSVRELLAGAGGGRDRTGRQPETHRVGDLPVTISHEPERLGTSGGLWGAAALLRGGGTFLCINSDMITGIDLAAAAAEHRRRGRAASLVLVPWQQGCTDTQVHHESGVLTAFVQPGVAGDDAGNAGAAAGGAGDPPGIFTGIHFLEEEILDRLPPGRSEFLPDLYLPMLAAGDPPGVIMTTETWMEVGTPARYLEAQLTAQQSPAPPGHRAWSVINQSTAPVAQAGPLGDDVIMDSTVRCEAGVSVSRSLLMEGVRLGAGSHLQEVIAGPDTCIPAGLHISRAILAPAAGMPATGLPDNVRLWEGMLRADF
jgi:NDP-sugar pyrophosphorylase family protein